MLEIQIFPSWPIIIAMVCIEGRKCDAAAFRLGFIKQRQII
jgi:hypothetical protein